MKHNLLTAEAYNIYLTLFSAFESKPSDNKKTLVTLFTNFLFSIILKARSIPKAILVPPFDLIY